MAVLTAEQKRQLNDIYIRIVKKYKTAASESVFLPSAKIMTLDEAKSIALLEFADKRQKIQDDYNARVDYILANAQQRGLQNSTLVIELLDKALVRKNEQLSRFNNLTDKMAKKIFNENQKIVIATEKEKTMQRTRAMRDYMQLAKMKLTVSYNEQSLIYEEVGNAHLEWLLQYTSAEATGYLTDNAAYFTACMGSTKYNEIKTKVV